MRSRTIWGWGRSLKTQGIKEDSPNHGIKSWQLNELHETLMWTLVAGLEFAANEGKHWQANKKKLLPWHRSHTRWNNNSVKCCKTRIWTKIKDFFGCVPIHSILCNNLANANKKTQKKLFFVWFAVLVQNIWQQKYKDCMKFYSRFNCCVAIIYCKYNIV